MADQDISNGTEAVKGKLYQRVQNLNTKSASKVAEVKRAIIEKSGTVMDFNSLTTLPDEINSIKTISTSTSELCVKKRVDIINEKDLAKCEYNENSGIFVGTFKDSTNMLVINTNLHHSEKDYMRLVSLPANEDGAYTYKSYTGSDVEIIFSIDEYLFIRFNGSYDNSGYPITYFTSDGKKWSRNMADIINGARSDIRDIVAIYPWGATVTSDFGIYDYDFSAREVRKSTNMIPERCVNMEAIVLESVAILIPKYSTFSLSTIYYVKLDDPYNINAVPIADSYAINSARIYAMRKTSRNTISILLRNTSGKYCAYEMYVNITQNGAVTIDFNKIDFESNIVLSPLQTSVNYTSTTIGRYTLFALDEYHLYYSDNMDDWKLAYYSTHKESDLISVITTILFTFYDGTYLHVIDNTYRHTLLEVAIISADDVPKNKVFINTSGELCRGNIGSNYSSLHSTGRICNMMVDTNTLFDNKVIFDPTYHHISFNQIIFYIDSFYYLIGYKNHIMLMKSADGYKWRCIYETTESPIIFSPSNYNRWRLEIIDGKLYLIQHGHGVNSYGPTRIIISANDEVEFVSDKSICWNVCDKVDTTILQYLYNACDGVVYAKKTSVDSNQIDSIIVMNRYGYTPLLTETCVVNTYLEVYNQTNAIVLVCDDHFVYAKDNKVYKSKSFGINDIDPATAQIYVYDDETLIIVQRTIDSGIPFIKFFHINKADMTVDDIPISSLPSGYDIFIRRPYLPVVVLKESYLYINDYNNREIGLVIDLEDNFKVVRYEDNTSTHTHTSMQYCNGILFVIDSYTKEYSTYTNDLEQLVSWKGVAGNDKGFYSIAGGNAVSSIWYSSDGLIYTPLDAPENYYPEYIAGVDTSIIMASNELTNKVLVISPNDEFEPTFYELPENLYIQNVEAQHSPEGTELYVFGKLNENDPYNVVYKSTNDHTVWVEIGITTISDPTARSVWRDITCNNDEVWVAIAANTTNIITSTDGVEWQNSTMPYDVAWDAVVSTDTMFVAVARGTNKAAYSYDGIIWEPYELSKEADWCGVAFGGVNGVGTLTIIAANTTTVLCGPDIFNLKEYDSAKNLDYVRLIYQDNKFVALARNSRYSVYSFNGIDWEYALLPVSADWKYLLYASGAFVAIDANCKNMTSSINGMNWIAETIEEGRKYRLIDYHNDKFVIFEFVAGEDTNTSHETGEDNTNEYGDYSVSYIGTSDTLKEWIDCVVVDYNTVIGSKDGIVVAKMGSDVNWSDSTLPLLDSELEYDWLKITAPLHEEWTGILEHGRYKVLFAKDCDSFLFSENYGDAWVRKEFTEHGDWSCGVYGLNRFVVFSDNNPNYQFSTDYGQTWRTDSHNIEDTFSCALYHSGTIYLFSKTSAMYYTTTDMENWVTHSCAQPFSKVIHTGKKFVAIVAGSDSFYTSEDGYEWTVNVYTLDEIGMAVSDYIVSMNFADIASGDNKIIVTIADSAYIIYSENEGETWNVITTPESNSLWNVHYVDRVFLLLGKDTSHNLVSTDCRNWSIGELHGKHDWALAYHDEFAYSINRIYAIPQNHAEFGYSYDGKFWYRSSTMSKLLYGNGIYVAADTSMENEQEVAIFYSSDCINWFVVKVVLDGKMSDIVFGDGKFVIITDTPNTWMYESVNVIDWTIRDIGFPTTKKYIAHNHLGFAILTDTTTVHLVENSVRFMNTLLSSKMNQVIGESNGTVVLLDYSTYTLYMGSKGSDTFTPVTEFELDNTRNWQIFSTESSIFVTSEADMWIFNTIRNGWYHLEYELDDQIVGIQEGIIEYRGTERVGYVYTGSRIYFITNLYDVSADISILSKTDLLYLTLPAGTKGICPNITHKTMLTFTNDTIKIYGRMAVLGYGGSSSVLWQIEFSEISSTTPDIEGNIVDIAFANGKFIMITDTNNYYISDDAIDWASYTLIDGVSGMELMAGSNFFVGSYINEEKIGYFYTENGEDIHYYDLEEEYGNDIDVTVTPNSLYIAKYDDVITELVFYDKTIMMSAAGSREHKADFINPKKTRFAKGNFEITSDEKGKYIDLDFTPRMVIIDSIAGSSAEQFKHIVLSSAEDVYQNINPDLNIASDNIVLVKNNSSITIQDARYSRIVRDGFIFENLDLSNGTYIYYAFN